MKITPDMPGAFFLRVHCHGRVLDLVESVDTDAATAVYIPRDANGLPESDPQRPGYAKRATTGPVQLRVHPDAPADVFPGFPREARS